MTACRKAASTQRVAESLGTNRPTLSVKHFNAARQEQEASAADASGLPEDADIRRFEDDGGLVADDIDLPADDSERRWS